MNQNHFDASVGLAFNLKLFERYRKSGILYAELHHIPKVRGRCKGYLQLVEGKVTSCYIEDKDRQRIPTDKNLLIEIDERWGPFEWILESSPVPVTPVQERDRERFPQPQPKGGPIPGILAPLVFQQGDGWTTQQKTILKRIYDAINGQRTIEEIKMEVPFAPNMTEEAIRVLLELRVIHF